LIRNVATPAIVSFLIGWGMMGGISYLPIYFQIAHGDSPTVSGLKLIPLMFGTVGGAVASGGFITKTGYFWPWPVTGAALQVLGLSLLAGLLAVHMNIYALSAIIFVSGLGMGLNVQSLLITVQGAVQRELMAIATATNTFLRTLGGVVGVAVYGSILNNQLSHRLSAHLLAVSHGGHAAIDRLPSAEAQFIIKSYVDSLKIVFWSGVPVAALALIVAFCIQNYKLQMSAALKELKDKGKEARRKPSDVEAPVAGEKQGTALP